MLFSLAVAACIGLGTTWLVVARDTAFGAVPIGAWVAWPKSGTRDVDPYTRATFARTGELPVGSGRGGAVYARTDDNTPPLAPRGFTSQEVGRRSDGSFDIMVAPRIRPGNWLPTNGVDSYVLVLRLYDSPVGVATRAAREAPMPSLTVESSPGGAGSW